MNRVIINLEALRHNMQQVERLMSGYGASWSVVTKALCGHVGVLRALHLMGMRSIADSRLDNLRVASESLHDVEKWYLRLPPLSSVGDLVELADVSLNTEEKVIAALSREARKRDIIHKVVIMIELGDLREGILPGTLVDFYEKVFSLDNIEVIGIGAQIGCLGGAVPNVDHVAHLLLYRELLELKFSKRLPVISAGSSIFLPLLMEGGMPAGVNHFRIGEALFLGTDLVNGGLLDGFRDDVIRLEAEIAEVKEKSLVPTGETTDSQPFESVGSPEANGGSPGQRGYRALVTVGQLDTDVAGLTPVSPAHHIAGASSDISVVNLGDDPGGLSVGDTITFKTSYSAFVGLMNDSYIAKVLEPDVETFAASLRGTWDLVPPAIPALAHSE